MKLTSNPFNMGFSSMIPQPVVLCPHDTVCHSAPQFIVISAFGAVLSAAAAAALHHLPGDTARSLACGGPRLGAGLQVHTHHLVDGQGNGHGHQSNPIHGLEVLALLEAIAQVLAPRGEFAVVQGQAVLGLAAGTAPVSARRAGDQA